LVDDWGFQQQRFQIVDVRSKMACEAGHLPNALSIPWRNVAGVNSLRRIDPRKTAVVYSENGQIGQLVATVLNLLGYRAVALKFGMMGWNSRYVKEADLYRGAAGYGVEVSASPPGLPGDASVNSGREPASLCPR
jgi:rhodanese-related sulfurtransferase